MPDSTDPKPASATLKPTEHCQRCLETEEFWREEIELRDAAIKELREELALASSKPSPRPSICPCNSKDPVVPS